MRVEVMVKPFDPSQATEAPTEPLPLSPPNVVSPLAMTEHAEQVREGRKIPDRSQYPERLGRYIVSGVLGRGGMGVVLSAHDPQLDRKVAIKLLRFAGTAEDGQRRLLREAQSMAKLSHPNVVAVHDVGEVDGQVFIAMEFVEGVTLREWMRTPQSWPEILRVYLDAGRGVAAAHARGIVHRDFKPDNVMIRNDDGRVLVMDFGLAQTDLLQHYPHSEGTSSDLTKTTSFSTHVGALVGTPAYMSPEQFLASRVDARSDQFGYCVSLFESLYGQHPFPAETIMEQTLVVTSSKPVHPASTRGIPAGLYRVILRGLSTNPESRWPSMLALLHALELKGRRRLRLSIVALAGTLILSLGGAVLYAERGRENEAAGGRSSPLVIGVQTPASLKIDSDPRNTIVSIDGTAVGRTPVAMPVVPGKHLVRLTREGYIGLEREVTFIAGVNEDLHFSLEAVPERKDNAGPRRAAVAVVEDTARIIGSEFIGRTSRIVRDATATRDAPEWFSLYKNGDGLSLDDRATDKLRSRSLWKSASFHNFKIGFTGSTNNYPTSAVEPDFLSSLPKSPRGERVAWITHDGALNAVVGMTVFEGASPRAGCALVYDVGDLIADLHLPREGVDGTAVLCNGRSLPGGPGSGAFIESLIRDTANGGIQSGVAERGKDVFAFALSNAGEMFDCRLSIAVWRRL